MGKRGEPGQGAVDRWWTFWFQAGGANPRRDAISALERDLAWLQDESPFDIRWSEADLVVLVDGVPFDDPAELHLLAAVARRAASRPRGA